MADYVPPVGTADLNLTGLFSPPVGTVDLDISATAGDDRTLTVSARTGGARAIAAVAYDPNLLSAIHAVTGAAWQTADALPVALVEPLQPAAVLRGEGLARWQAAASAPAGTVETWRAAARVVGSGFETWQDAGWAGNGGRAGWQSAAFAAGSVSPNWQDGRLESNGVAARFRVRLPLFSPETRAVWQDGGRAVRSWIDRSGDGRRLIAVDVAVWQRAGYPSNARRGQRPKPPSDSLYHPPIGLVDLDLRCPLPASPGAIHLNLGRVPCVAQAARWIPTRRSYMVVNSASLVRWPDLTPLPVTAMTVETDADSWCWSLSATLAGPDAWDLVQPNPLACEVLATINGHDWIFLLDVPNRSRRFNQDRTALKGRSRSAWLHSPYTAPTSGVEANAREMAQLAEQALDNLGWTLVWNVENWVVPAGRHAWNGTPIDRLMQLVGATDDCLYTDPESELLTVYSRWPMASWLIDGATADVAVPEAAILNLSMAPTYRPPLNGVYVSGTTHGAVALVKIAGTDGALQPAEPIAHELLCDAEGVAARARGLNALSDSGAGTDLTAELLLVEPVGVIRPGLIASLAGVKGISRSVRIAATWSNGLQVRQTVGLERREVEA
ncbi:MAG: hypothetical protein RKR03_09270 [Candidatus Competibacter sp.]|nr:hypothetical protein [Candidatus Competibacter sp.]